MFTPLACFLAQTVFPHPPARPRYDHALGVFYFLFSSTISCLPILFFALFFSLTQLIFLEHFVFVAFFPACGPLLDASVLSAARGGRRRRNSAGREWTPCPTTRTMKTGADKMATISTSYHRYWRKEIGRD